MLAKDQNKKNDPKIMTDSPVLDLNNSAIKSLIKKGKVNGFVTLDELNAALPPGEYTSEQIEDIHSSISEMGFNIVDQQEDTNTEDNEDRTAGNLSDDEGARSDDPVRMYLREMGSVELLSREGEISIAKRIEAGKELMIGGIYESPLAMRAFLKWRDEIDDGTMLVRDVIDLETTYARINGGANEPIISSYNNKDLKLNKIENNTNDLSTGTKITNDNQEVKSNLENENENESEEEDEKPKKEWLRKIHECEDEKVLKYFLNNMESHNIKDNKDTLELLWECCQIPDFVKKTYGNHIEVVGKVFGFLNGISGKISNDYMRIQLMKLDNLDGNVDSLSNRIANVRTWSYVSNKINWVENQNYWIEKTKILEDRLSERLHEELTRTFIDKRASILARGLKQDMDFKTEIMENDKVVIDGQFIGNLKGLKFEMDLKAGALETDIKSLKKAARQTVGPELKKRIQLILDTGLIEIKNDFKIYWRDFPIAKLEQGKDYLNPEIFIIVDDLLDNKDKQNFSNFIEKWIKEKIELVLKSLIDLKNLKESNSSIKALAYQLYENNGVLKRENVTDYLKKLGQEERKILRELGVKFGRYHIFLYKLLKPEAVSLRILLWKNFHQKFLNLTPPTFGLNFVEDKNAKNKNFMLLCGFENFENYFVRIDILERLFVQIINSNPDKNKEIRLVPEMLNLLGCNKQNFQKLIEKMNYKTFEKENVLNYIFSDMTSDRYQEEMRSRRKLGESKKITKIRSIR